MLGRSEQEIGVTEDFFALGGHSLTATQVVARIRDLFEVELPLTALLRPPHHRRDRRMGAHRTMRLRATLPRSPGASSEETAPLSFSQERMWFMQANARRRAPPTT